MTDRRNLVTFDPDHFAKRAASDRPPNALTAFRYAYYHNLWRGEQTPSGAGSSVAQTRAITDALPELCERYRVRALLDVPCGERKSAHISAPRLAISWAYGARNNCKSVRRDANRAGALLNRCNRIASGATRRGELENRRAQAFGVRVPQRPFCIGAQASRAELRLLQQVLLGAERAAGGWDGAEAVVAWLNIDRLPFFDHRWGTSHEFYENTLTWMSEAGLEPASLAQDHPRPNATARPVAANLFRLSRLGTEAHWP